MALVLLLLALILTATASHYILARVERLERRRRR